MAEVRRQLLVGHPAATDAEREQLEQNVSFFDKECDYHDEFSEGLTPEETAEANIDAADWD